MNVVEKQLVPGISLILAGTDQFKTDLFSVTFVTPMARETVTANALVMDVLNRGSRQYPDIQSLSAAQDELYGLTVTPAVRQKGEIQCVGLRAGLIDEGFALDGAPLLEPALDFVAQLLLDPLVEDGAFLPDYVAGEGANLADHIRGRINDKRTYASHRLIQLMCGEEAYGLDKYGFAAEAEGMDPGALFRRYRALLEEARVVFYYSGACAPERVEAAVRRAFAPMLTPRAGDVPATAVVAGGGEVRTWTDRMDVTQGKLALGFRTGGIAAGHPLSAALTVANIMYGGSSNSKLFLNVRERLSLCYYASSGLDKLKGLMMVSSGVEFSQFQRAREEILAQLKAMQEGDFTPEELRVGKQSAVSAWRSLQDSQGRTEDYWLGQVCAGTWEAPESVMEKLEAVTARQVAEAARQVRLDTVYYLTGEEGEDHG